MVHGANKSGSRKKKFVRTPSGTKERYHEKRPGRAKCPSGRPLAGTASGTHAQLEKLSKTQKRPSRPFGGVLSAPVTKQLMRDKAALTELSGEPTKTKDVYTPGRVCMKIAGRDAGKYCIILEEKDGKVLIDGQTRRRYVSPAHLEPLQRTVKIAKSAKTADAQKALQDLGIETEEPKKTPRKTAKKQKASE